MLFVFGVLAIAAVFKVAIDDPAKRAQAKTEEETRHRVRYLKVVHQLRTMTPEKQEQLQEAVIRSKKGGSR